MAEPRTISTTHIEDRLAIKASTKAKAALFNLIISIPDGEHLSYVEGASRRILSKFPCRVFFLLEDPDPKHDFLQVKAGIKVVNEISCDQIQIEFAGGQRERVPFILLPHLLPDLPVHWLWIGDPRPEDLLFTPFKNSLTSIILDLDSLEGLLTWGPHVLSSTTILSDLKWAATDGWRRILSTVFSPSEKLARLQKSRLLKVVYSTRSSTFFRDARLQAFYLQGCGGR